jgi:hypothetical protein
VIEPQTAYAINIKLFENLVEISIYSQRFLREEGILGGGNSLMSVVCDVHCGANQRQATRDSCKEKLSLRPSIISHCRGSFIPLELREMVENVSSRA